ncbi:MAG: T9SS type A sorting domain-containing protein [Bacteroidetes bacterium]|nr:T9SS type A sorting domain-containing protein [Bacteroidota bacterium]MBK7571525.1 T9SS type A sorting domain-containing protein [Bacteroidota bacterium]MBK8584361.1 T9SS type A sorting domain-containing protein [Bacteroidota bacterium]
MKKNLLLTLVTFLVFLSASAQIDPVSLGNWRMHIPYNKGIQVAEDYQGKIYCATQFGMFSYEKSSGEFDFFTTLNGLSDNEISNIRFDQTTKILMITYLNSNIDIILPDKTIINLPDIKQKSIVGGKKINSITFINGLAYLGCEFGIVIIDLQKQEVKDTYFIGPNSSNLNVMDVAFNGTDIIATTETGVYKAYFYDPAIFNFNAWAKDLTLVEPNANYTSAAVVDNKFVIVKTNAATEKDSVFMYDGSSWFYFINEDYKGAYVDDHNGKIVYRNGYRLAVYDALGNKYDEIDIFSGDNLDFRKGFLDADGYFWVADFRNGLYGKFPDNTYHKIYPNGPGAEAVYSMQALKNKVWVASGSIDGDKAFFDIKNGIYRFADGNWKTFNRESDSVYDAACRISSPAVSSVAIDPNDPEHVFVASYGAGILEYQNDKGVRIYNTLNSTISQVTVSDSNDIRVGGLTFDDDGNLWAVTGYTISALTVKRASGGWFTYQLPDPGLIDVVCFKPVVDDYGQKWFIGHKGASNGAGLFVVKEASLSSNSGLKFKQYTNLKNYGNLPDLFVRSLAKDKDGAIWIGTNQGVAVVYNPGSVFDGTNYDAQKVIIEQDGYAQYLLETENVNAIAIDAANRKWFGTANGGLFLMSADGTKQLLNFNTENSPLPSNNITDIAVNDVTGEVFIGTDKGLISYQGDATEGGETCEDYLVFPNPVLHNYNGPIAIKGLINNADVKITDVAGNIVFHTKANGGLATWNGMNYKGERAQTGVYIVYVSNEDGTQTCTTKMLFSR